MITSLVFNDQIAYCRDLRYLVEKALGTSALEQLHLLKDYPLFERSNDQSTIWHERFYQFARTDEWQETYDGFMATFVKKFGGPIVYQSVPTFRVHLPDNVAVGEMHRDRDYGHSVDEVNVWVALTDSFDTAAVQIEKGDTWVPMEVPKDSYAIFDGANLHHGNVPNETGKTRVSFDARIIPEHLYVPSDRTSINTHMKFMVGDYFATT